MNGSEKSTDFSRLQNGKAILNGSNDLGKNSVQQARNVLEEILTYHRKNKLTVPLSLNIETVTLRNLSITQHMVEMLSPAIKQDPAGKL